MLSNKIWIRTPNSGWPQAWNSGHFQPAEWRVWERSCVPPVFLQNLMTEPYTAKSICRVLHYEGGEGVKNRDGKRFYRLSSLVKNTWIQYYVIQERSLWKKKSQLKIWREKFVRRKRRIRSFRTFIHVRFVRQFVWKERKRAINKQTVHGNWRHVFCNNVLKFYTHTMDSLGENEFCETIVKEKKVNERMTRFHF